MALNDDTMPATFLRWTRGNKEAASFLMLVANIVRLADDIIDGDAKNPSDEMAHLLELCMCGLISNKFYRVHAERLSSTIWLGVFGWRMSEEWKGRELPKTQMFAFVYRELIEQVAYKTALICGGRDHAKAVADELHRMSHVEGNPETFEDWQKEQV